MKPLPLGLPLLASAAGTLLTLALPSKQGHIAFGLAWAGLSALHAWQYRKKLSQDLKRNGGLFSVMHLPQSRLELFIRTVEVAAYIPGRIRLYARPLTGNAALARQTEAELLAATGVTSARVNTTTGSILIEYDPEKLRQNPELARIEEYVRTHVKKRRG